MNYPRVPYKAEGAAFTMKRPPYGLGERVIPDVDYPISPIENFKLSWTHQTPVWAPIAQMDFDTVALGKTSGFDHLRMKNIRFEFTDEWGCQWVYIPEAGGSMLKPGTQLLDDITKWERAVRLPDWKTQDFSQIADKYYSSRKDKSAVLSVDIGSGGTERLVAILGGYEQAMIAMATEQEAVLDFLNASAENMNERYSIIKEHYPDVNMITFHDDWGTERDTFFSEKYLEAMVLEPTKKVIDHVKASGDICFQLHCCGKIERFVPYMIDLGVDMLQLQHRNNNFSMLKEKYGDKIGLGCMVEGVDLNADAPKEEWIKKVRQTIDSYGKNGGIYISLGYPQGDELLWDICYEAFCYSREFYDKERA